MNPQSWVESANAPGADFPLQNLPYGVFEEEGRSRIGIAIGDRILDLHGCARTGLLRALAPEVGKVCQEPTLNGLMALGRANWSALRRRITALLLAETQETAANRQRAEPLLVPMSEAVMKLPAAIGDYTDFFASLYHATNVGRMFRPDDPLPPNYKYVPLGYHGRASSIIVSGAEVRRPTGQAKRAGADGPGFGATRSLDFELEVGLFVGPGNTLGEPVSIDEADAHIFGFCLLNDWSARDLQAWESQPLGPFLAKSFATTISPWIVTAEALEPFRAPAFTRGETDPPLMAYLESERERRRGAIDVTLEVYLASRRMKQQRMPPLRLTRSSARHLIWTPAQMVAHHTSNGCNLRPGDLIGSGTVSGPSTDSLGCLLEITQRGAQPIELPTGEKRAFLEDGDEVILRGYCEHGDAVRIGFGECRGTIAAPPSAGKAMSG